MVCKGIVYVYESFVRFLWFNGNKWVLNVYSGDNLIFESSHYTKDSLSRDWSENYKNFAGDLLKVSKFYRQDLVMELVNHFSCGN